MRMARALTATAPVALERAWHTHTAAAPALLPHAGNWDEGEARAAARPGEEEEGREEEDEVYGDFEDLETGALRFVMCWADLRCAGGGQSPTVHRCCNSDEWTSNACELRPRPPLPLTPHHPASTTALLQASGLRAARTPPPGQRQRLSRRLRRRIWLRSGGPRRRPLTPSTTRVSGGCRLGVGRELSRVLIRCPTVVRLWVGAAWVADGGSLECRTLDGAEEGRRDAESLFSCCVRHTTRVCWPSPPPCRRRQGGAGRGAQGQGQEARGGGAGLPGQHMVC